MTGSAVDAGLIGATVPGAAVLTGDDCDAYRIAGLRPGAVVRPQTVEQVAAVLRLANEQGWSVSPRGGGTMLDLGNPPRSLDIALDLTALDQVIDYQPDDLTLTVQAGVTLSVIEQVLTERRQILALDVPLPNRATIGGALATNASGPRRMRYGTARDLCIGMQVALPYGTLARGGGKVVKNVAGYDLNKLHIGALGSVGAITEATFKLWPAPAARGAVGAVFDSFAAAHRVSMQLLNGRLFPAALEIVGPGAAERIASGSGVVPGPQAWLLAVLMLGSAGAVVRQVRDIAAICNDAGAAAVTILADAELRQIFDRIRDLGWHEDDGAELIVRAAVLPSESARAVEIIERLGEALHATPEMLCRPSAGLVFGYWRGLAEAAPVVALQRARADLQAFSGTLVIERAPASIVAGIDVWGVTGADLTLMRQLKQTFDPNGTLNPGRFVEGL
ncbi:MAG: FAD-binding oxidoreductase [Dehalococcoidia bacterium]